MHANQNSTTYAGADTGILKGSGMKTNMGGARKLLGVAYLGDTDYYLSGGGGGPDPPPPPPPPPPPSASAERFSMDENFRDALQGIMRLSLIHS